jgi:hypothetical protein
VSTWQARILLNIHSGSLNKDLEHANIWATGKEAFSLRNNHRKNEKRSSKMIPENASYLKKQNHIKSLPPVTDWVENR